MPAGRRPASAPLGRVDPRRLGEHVAHARAQDEAIRIGQLTRGGASRSTSAALQPEARRQRRRAIRAPRAGGRRARRSTPAGSGRSPRRSSGRAEPLRQHRARQPALDHALVVVAARGAGLGRLAPGCAPRRRRRSRGTGTGRARSGKKSSRSACAGRAEQDRRLVHAAAEGPDVLLAARQQLGERDAVERRVRRARAGPARAATTSADEDDTPAASGIVPVDAQRSAPPSRPHRRRATPRWPPARSCPSRRRRTAGSARRGRNRRGGKRGSTARRPRWSRRRARRAATRTSRSMANGRTGSPL